MANRDSILLETVRAHRERLLAAFLFGELDERRPAGDNVKRLIGSAVLAAVATSSKVCATRTSPTASRSASSVSTPRRPRPRSPM